MGLWDAESDTALLVQYNGQIQDISDKLVKDQNTGGVSSPMVMKGPQNKLPDSQYNDLSEAGGALIEKV